MVTLARGNTLDITMEWVIANERWSDFDEEDRRAAHERLALAGRMIRWTREDRRAASLHSAVQEANGKRLARFAAALAPGSARGDEELGATPSDGSVARAAGVRPVTCRPVEDEHVLSQYSGSQPCIHGSMGDQHVNIRRTCRVLTGGSRAPAALLMISAIAVAGAGDAGGMISGGSGGGPGRLQPSAGPDEAAERAVARIDQLFKRLEGYGFAGVVLVADRETIRLAEGYGLANRESGLAWSPEIVSDLGSITKQFTGAAILVLEEQGKLRTDDPITKYLPDVPPDKREITIHHLLTHSSGIQDLPGRGDWDPIGRDEIVRLLMEAPLSFGPGERYGYSNAGYSLLGVIIEQVTGGSYEQFVRQTLLLPAGMRHTGYVLPEFDPALVAQGYRDGKRWGTTLERPMDKDGPYWVLRANGGVHSTARDMHAWALALIEGRVLGARSMKKLWTPHVRERGAESAYGYGWSIVDLPDGQRMVGHNGGNPAHIAALAILPEKGLILFAQCNVHADFQAAEGVFNSVLLNLVEGAPLPDLPPAVRPMTAEHAEQYVGHYKLESGGSVQVTFERGGLRLEPVGRDAWAALGPPTDADAETLARRSGTVQSFMEAMQRGDYQPNFEAYGGRVPLARLQETGGQRRRRDEERLGPWIGVETLGTAGYRDGMATMVRVQHERGAVYRRYLWNAEGQLTGFHPLTSLPEPPVYRPADGGVLAAIDHQTLAVYTVHLDEGDRGRLVLRLGGTSATRAD